MNTNYSFQSIEPELSNTREALRDFKKNYNKGIKTILVLRTTKTGNPFLEAIPLQFSNRPTEWLSFKLRKIPQFIRSILFLPSKEIYNIDRIFQHISTCREYRTFRTRENNAVVKSVAKIFKRELSQIVSPTKSIPTSSSQPSSDVDLDVKIVRRTNPGIVGARIENGFNRCYFNSSLKALKACPLLLEQVVLLHAVAKGSQKIILSKLLEFFEECNENKLITQRKKGTSSTIDELAEMLSQSIGSEIGIAGTRQQDAQEFINLLFDKVLQLPTFSAQQLNHHGLEGNGFTVNSLDSAKVEPYSMMTVDLPRSSHSLDSIQEVFTGFTQNESVDIGSIFSNLRSEKKEEEVTKLTSFIQSRKITSPSIEVDVASSKRIVGDLPQVLPFQIKRFYADDRYQLHKNTQKVELPFILKVATSESANKEADVRFENYILRAVVVHQGNSPTSGHYYTYMPDPSKAVFNDGKWECPDWMEHNDSPIRVAPRKYAEIQKDIETNGYVIFYEKIDK